MPAEECFDEFRERVGEVTEEGRDFRPGQSGPEGFSKRWRFIAQLGFKIDEKPPKGIAVQDPILPSEHTWKPPINICGIIPKRLSGPLSLGTLQS
jgi:hypothetical protein